MAKAQSPQPTALPLDSIPVISARDADLKGLFPTGFEDRYEVHSYRNAAHILRTSCKDEFNECVELLMAFSIKTEDMVKAGGNKSEIAKAVEGLFQPRGWNETRIVGDLQITRISRFKEGRRLKSGLRKGELTFEPMEQRDLYRIPGFVDGHKVDFVKGRVAFDMEWNSKDQTFDRDLYAVRAFYDCNIVTAGVLLTRSAELIPLFEEISARVDIKQFKSKFGASTTWMKKLTYRLDAGRAGGCPILALGIRPTLVGDFEKWKDNNPVKREAAPLDIDEPVPDEDAQIG